MYVREVTGSNSAGPEAVLTIRGLRLLLKIEVCLDRLLPKMEAILFFKLGNPLPVARA